MINYQEQVLLGKWLRIVGQTYLKKFVQRSSEKFHFRCPLCGDSKQSDKKKRGWILKFKGEWIFHCFNCSHTNKGKTFLKKNYPNEYRMFLNETIQINKTIIEPVVEPITEKVEKSNKELPINDFHVRISKHSSDPIIAIADEYCRNRKIPEEIYLKWFVCYEGKYKNRLIIPFYDENGNFVYFQGRALLNQHPKYLNKEGSRDFIYNINNIDKSKPVIVLEGVFDSIFVENSIAVLSTKWSEEIDKILQQLNCYYLLDYDLTNETRIRCQDLLEKGRYVFNWRKFISDAKLSPDRKWDINELVIEKNIKFIKFNHIKRYFTNSYYDKIYFI